MSSRKQVLVGATVIGVLATHILSRVIRSKYTRHAQQPTSEEKKESEKEPAYTHMLRHTRIVLVDCNDIVQAEKLVNGCLEAEELAHGSVRVVGLDAEWNSPGTTPVAVLQMATRTCVFVFLIGGRTEPCPRLKTMLEDSDILKVGVGISADASRISSLWPSVIIGGCVDLGDVAAQCDPLAFPQRSLGGLVHGVLGVHLPKSRSVRCGDWECRPLSEQQVLYAAADAWYGRELLWGLTQYWCDENGRNLFGDEREMKKSMERSGVEAPSSSLPFTSQKWEDEVEWDIVQMLTSSLPPVIVSTKPKKVTRTDNRNRNRNNKNREAEKQRRAMEMGLRQAPLYDNARILSPAGEFMCTCDTRRVRWYVTRGLAKVETEDPLTIRLTFTPKGPGNAGNSFYEVGCVNRCVVCGHDGGSFVRHHVVPRLYRRHMPEVVKSHSSHDIVLLCKRCHLQAERHALSLMNDIARETGFPIQAENVPRGSTERLKFHRYAKALLTQGQNIPEQRRLKLQEELAEYLGVEILELTNERLAGLSDPSDEENDIVALRESHGALVVQGATKAGQLQAFIRRCRVHFLEKNAPKFLSPYWSVDHTRPNDSHKLQQQLATLAAGEEQEQEQEEQEQEQEQEQQE